MHVRSNGCGCMVSQGDTETRKTETPKQKKRSEKGSSHPAFRAATIRTRYILKVRKIFRAG